MNNFVDNTPKAWIHLFDLSYDSCVNIIDIITDKIHNKDLDTFRKTFYYNENKIVVAMYVKDESGFRFDSNNSTGLEDWIQPHVAGLHLEFTFDTPIELGSIHCINFTYNSKEHNFHVEYMSIDVRSDKQIPHLELLPFGDEWVEKCKQIDMEKFKINMYRSTRTIY